MTQNYKIHWTIAQTVRQNYQLSFSYHILEVQCFIVFNVSLLRCLKLDFQTTRYGYVAVLFFEIL